MEDSFLNFYINLDPAALLTFIDVKLIVRRDYIGFNARFNMDTIRGLLDVGFEGNFNLILRSS